MLINAGGVIYYRVLSETGSYHEALREVPNCQVTKMPVTTMPVLCRLQL